MIINSLWSVRCVSFDHKPTENDLSAVIRFQFSIFFLMLIVGMRCTIQSTENGYKKIGGKLIIRPQRIDF